jgi:excisionase family DNA binding protein
VDTELALASLGGEGIVETFFTVRELAYRLKVAEITVSRWLRDSKLEFVEISPRRRLISEAAVQEFLRPKRVQPRKALDRRPMLIKDSKAAKRSLTIEGRSGGVTAEDDVKSLRKEIASLWR